MTRYYNIAYVRILIKQTQVALLKLCLASMRDVILELAS